MAKASDNEFPSVLFDEQTSAPTTPSTGLWRAYFKSDGFYAVDDAGTEYGPFVSPTAAVAYIDATEAAAPAAPSTGEVRLYAKTDGLLYSKDDAGTETLVSGGSGGGGGGSSVPDWIATLADPASANTDDDEFDDDSITGWTSVTPTGTATWTESGDRLAVYATGMTSGDAAAQLKAMTDTTAPIRIKTHVRGYFDYQTSNVLRIGLGFTDGLVAGSNFHGVGFQIADNSGPASRVQAIAGTLTNITTATKNVTGQTTSQSIFDIFLRLDWTAANTWQAYISPDGENWSDLGGGTFSHTMTPTHYGLFVVGTSTSKVFASFEYFRVETT